jgi:hypothetical protein
LERLPARFVLVAPDETKLHEVRAAILTELFVEAPSSDGVIATVHGVAISESASRMCRADCFSSQCSGHHSCGPS